MSLTEHYQQIDNERLRAALVDAIAYLRLMPRVPVTSAKIADLEKALSLPKAIGQFEDGVAWQIERRTPIGEVLRVHFADSELRFETEAALPKGATVPYELTVADLDALIDVLVACRQNRI